MTDTATRTGGTGPDMPRSTSDNDMRSAHRSSDLDDSHAEAARANAEPELRGTTVWTTPLFMGAIASAGAGMIHAAAVGTHNTNRTVALVFAATAVVQLGWAGVALARRRTDVALAGLAINAVALAAWGLSRTRGLPVIEGFAEKAEVGTQDLMGAILAGLAVVCIGGALVRRGPAVAVGVPNVFAGSFAALVVVALAVPGMAAVHDSSHHGPGNVETAGADHHGGEAASSGGSGSGADHDAGAAAAPAAAGDHHGGGAAGGTSDHDMSSPDHDMSSPDQDMSSPDHDMGAMEGTVPHSTAVAVPYDPTKPVDLGGTPGVSPQEQAEAEDLVERSLAGLPQWADPEYALSKGFVSIGDGFTGTEHFVNQEFMDDDSILDPNRPESLVWDVENGKRTLAAAMYMTKPGVPLADVPKIGGKLIQWHVHSNLCYNAEGKVRGITDASGNCPAGLVKPVQTPMVHVWIRKHPCGPFAALEGIGGGDIAPGETRLCDTAHGSGH